jgi:hypothetical protein
MGLGNLAADVYFFPSYSPGFVVDPLCESLPETERGIDNNRYSYR